MTRTQDEILARIDEVKADDWIGAKRETLVLSLDAEHIGPFLMDVADALTWTPADIETDAREYLAFAIGKIIGHRGISASRSVDRLTQYAWLLGRDDIVAAMENADYSQYGAPKVKAFADGIGWPFERPEDPWASQELHRMAQGLPCQSGCEEGCDR